MSISLSLIKYSCKALKNPDSEIMFNLDMIEL